MIKADLATGEYRRLKRLLGEFKPRFEKQVMRKAIRAGGAINLQNLRRNVPRNNGHLKRSITQRIKTYRKNGAVVSIVGQKTDFVARNKRGPKHQGGLSGQKMAVPLWMIHRGTRAHRIVAQKAKALKLLMSRFGGQRHGQAVFARAVSHPGYRGTQVVSKTEAAGRAEIQRTINQKMELEIDREFMMGGGRSLK